MALDSGIDLSSEHICGFAHSLKANTLITPTPTTSQTLIHTVCLHKHNNKHGNYQRVKIVPFTIFAVRDMQYFL
jgi:hypothetical protein